MTYLDRAIKDGYAIITGPENKQKIIYVTSDNHTENYNDPEEKVRAEFWAELIYEYDYPAHRIKVEVTIPDRVPTDRADIVIFSDDECKKPYAVVECKRDGVTDAEFLQAIEQGVGNATWVKLRASYVVIIAGATRRVLDFSDDSTGILERENNIIADLPKAYILFAVNQFGQAFINPYAIGEILFGLDYLAAKGQAPSAEKQTTAEIWSYIHPLIQKSSKKLFEDGHFANAAEDAFIELNSRAKAIYKKLVPSAATVPDGTDLMHKLFGSNPLLCPVRDTGTESGNNYQQGFHFMTAGAMSALRNPKAHSNDEVLTAEEALRRLMFASMLMYKLDEAGL